MNLSNKVHLIGIGGGGMSALAQAAQQAGYAVTGSDRSHDRGEPAPALAALEQRGIRLSPQDGSVFTLDRPDRVVISTAIEADNPDLEKARSLGIPTLHRAELLAELCRNGEVIAVAGTAGKSTVTGMLGWIFECLGLNPSVYCGAPVLHWKTDSAPGNFRPGSSTCWIIEADESDRSFLRFHPRHAVITNIARDHFELDELHRLFNQFREQVEGVLIDGTDGANPDPTLDGFVFAGTEFQVPLPGRHNRLNAFLAVRLCHALGLDLSAVRDALATFQGIERRLERIGPRVLDDFAHSPVKIAAALEATAELFPRLCIYWRPHGFTPLARQFAELTAVFTTHARNRPQDRFFFLPVYYAGGTAERATDSNQLAEALYAAGVRAETVPDYNALESGLLGAASSDCGILGMGARDPALPGFARRIADRLG